MFRLIKICSKKSKSGNNTSQGQEESPDLFFTVTPPTLTLWQQLHHSFRAERLSKEVPQHNKIQYVFAVFFNQTARRDPPEGRSWEQPDCFQSRKSQWKTHIFNFELFESFSCILHTFRMSTVPLWPGWTWRGALRACRKRSPSSRRSTRRSVGPMIPFACLWDGMHCCMWPLCDSRHCSGFSLQHFIGSSVSHLNTPHSTLHRHWERKKSNQRTLVLR